MIIESNNSLQKKNQLNTREDSNAENKRPKKKQTNKQTIRHRETKQQNDKSSLFISNHFKYRWIKPQSRENLAEWIKQVI